MNRWKDRQINTHRCKDKNKINQISKSIIWLIKEAFYLFLKTDFCFRLLTYLNWIYIWEKMRYIIQGDILNQSQVQYGSLTIFVLLNLNKKLAISPAKWDYSGTTKELQSRTFNHEGPGASSLKQRRGNSYKGERRGSWEYYKQFSLLYSCRAWELPLLASLFYFK